MKVKMKVKKQIVFECPICKIRRDTQKEAEECFEKCKRIRFFESKYPEPYDPHCDFGNGNGYVQRNSKWYKEFVKDLKNLQNHPELKTEVLTRFNGSLGRILNDSNFPEYIHWLRLWCICIACYREWGQPYYANHCHHDGSYKTSFSNPADNLRTQVREYKEPKRVRKKINPSNRFS